MYIIRIHIKASLVAAAASYLLASSLPTLHLQLARSSTTVYLSLSLFLFLSLSLSLSTLYMQVWHVAIVDRIIDLGEKTLILSVCLSSYSLCSTCTTIQKVYRHYMLRRLTNWSHSPACLHISPHSAIHIPLLMSIPNCPR